MVIKQKIRQEARPVFLRLEKPNIAWIHATMKKYGYGNRERSRFVNDLIASLMEAQGEVFDIISR